MSAPTENAFPAKSKKDKEGDVANKHVSDDYKQHVREQVKFYESNFKVSVTTTAKASVAHVKSQNPRPIILHLVVMSVGLFILIFTLYLVIVAFQRGRDGVVNAAGAKNDEKQQPQQSIEAAAKRIKILEKLLEYKDLCTELEIFTKEHLKTYNTELADTTPDEDEEKDKDEDNNGDCSSNAVESVNDDNRIGRRRVAEKRNKNVKSENSENNYSNSNGNKKDQKQPAAKKANRAEPIIYLFALVFIYLLLKAASDINQHYKSQNKGDKRLRRCSLQSYAQTHKHGRRASKGSPKVEMRSNSIDRLNETNAHRAKMLANLRKYTSFDEQNRIANMNYAAGAGAASSSTSLKQLQNANLIRKVNNSEEVSNGLINNKDILTKLANRRCSVPASLNAHQRTKIGIATPSVYSGSNVSARRTSLIGGTNVGVGMEPPPMGPIKNLDYGQEAQSQFQYEVKRRVRMINRH